MLVLSLTGFEPKGNSGLHSTCLPASVTDRAMEAWPLAARAQQSAISVIGFLSGRSPNESQSVVKAFREGLREGGFVEGENLFIAFRWAEGRYDRLPALAAELVGLRVALLF